MSFEQIVNDLSEVLIASREDSEFVLNALLCAVERHCLVLIAADELFRSVILLQLHLLFTNLHKGAHDVHTIH